MKVVIKQWVPVAVWKWPNIDPTDNVCGICRAQFESTCPGCIKPGAACPPVTGQCSHSFHKHCIVTWLKKDTQARSCPMCRQPFISDALPDEEIGSLNSMLGSPSIDISLGDSEG